jgi:hypothetical protein
MGLIEDGQSLPSLTSISERTTPGRLSTRQRKRQMSQLIAEPSILKFAPPGCWSATGFPAGRRLPTRFSASASV